jgi:polysaccharide export outer membrane protein
MSRAVRDTRPVFPANPWRNRLCRKNQRVTHIPGRIGQFAAVLGILGLSACTTQPEGLPFGSGGIVQRVSFSSPLAAPGRGPTCGGSPLEPGNKGPDDVASFTPTQSYRVGPGDTLRFNIFNEPGMNDFTASVDSDGYVQLPVVEDVRVGGMTTREILGMLKDEYADSFVDPWLTVELVDAQSAPIYFLGEFREPGVRYMSGATNVLEAIALAGGLEEDAYLPGARLLRNDEICTVDLNALLRNGEFSQNVWIRPRDVIFAPRREDMSVYVLGAVASPQSVPFGATGRTLLEALAIAGGQVSTQAQMNGIRIIRTYSPTRGELIVFDASTTLVGLAPDFPLEPGDVVFVPNSAIGNWNDAIATILPTLTLIGGVITPIALIQSIQDSAN